jgi:hypothetical protein
MLKKILNTSEELTDREIEKVRKNFGAYIKELL